jgi:hypothetical protein
VVLRKALVDTRPTGCKTQQLSLHWVLRQIHGGHMLFSSWHRDVKISGSRTVYVKFEPNQFFFRWSRFLNKEFVKRWACTNLRNNSQQWHPVGHLPLAWLSGCKVVYFKTLSATWCVGNRHYISATSEGFGGTEGVSFASLTVQGNTHFTRHRTFLVTLKSPTCRLSSNFLMIINDLPHYQMMMMMMLIVLHPSPKMFYVQ